MRVINHITVRLGCVLVITATMLLSSKVAVLCNSDHGHAAIELAHQDSVCDHSSTNTINPNHAYVSDHCQSTCTDLALPPVVATKLTQAVESAGVDLADDPVLYEISWKPAMTVAVLRLPTARVMPHGYQTTRSLSSTILLI